MTMMITNRSDSSENTSSSSSSSSSMDLLYQAEFMRLKQEITLLQKEVQCVASQRDRYRYRLFGRKEGEKEEDVVLQELKVVKDNDDNDDNT